MKLLLAAAAALCLAGCAASPETIVAAPISTDLYAGHSCGQLKEERAGVAADLQTVSAVQSNARVGDTVGVIMLGLPVSSMAGGNVGPKVAEDKGRLAAIDAVRVRKGCPAG